MKLRADVRVLLTAITAFVIAWVSAAPVLAQSVREAHAAANPLPVLPLRSPFPAKLANSQNSLQDADSLLAPARNGLSRRQRREWLLLGIVQHGTAFFDARTTREAIGNHHRELDPLLRSFANSTALYPVMQIAPAGLDWFAIRLATSRHRWLRRVWWLPQAAAAAGFLWSGMHNLSLPSVR